MGEIVERFLPETDNGTSQMVYSIMSRLGLASKDANMWSKNHYFCALMSSAADEYGLMNIEKVLPLMENAYNFRKSHRKNERGKEPLDRFYLSTATENMKLLRKSIQPVS